MEKITTGTKICRECGRELPIGDFYVNDMSKDGHRNICKHCYIERKMQKRTNDPDHQVKHRTEMHEMKACTECGREFPESEFTDSMGRRVGTGRCRECREKKRKPRVGNGKGARHEYHARRYAENKDAIKVRNIERQLGRSVSEPPKLMPKPVKAERLCEKCPNWPCFAGIENLETDFAREGCHGFPRGEAS